MYILSYLQDPELVVRFQNYFGVYSLHENDSSCQSQDIKRKSIEEKRNEELKCFKGRTKNHCTKSYNENLENNNTITSYLSSVLFGDGTVGGSEERGLSSPNSETAAAHKFVIKNWFWYFLFHAATKCGDEIFYITFFPFWKWNVDGAVIRKVIYIWMITMYIGQALKDLIRVPRPPCPPVVRLDPKWGLEYGLPSTHAMVGFAIPFSLLSLSYSRYQLNYDVCLFVATLWCALVCLSRLYLGMHSILDVVVGLALAAVLLRIVLPVIDAWDSFMLAHPFSPIIAVTLTAAMVVCYPNPDRWTPARGDTTVIVGVGCGSLLGSWLNLQLGMIGGPPSGLRQPFAVMWPSAPMVGLSVLRTVLGLAVLVVVRALVKKLSIRLVCTLLHVNCSDYVLRPHLVPERRRLVVELCYKFLTYAAIGFTIVFAAPFLFKTLGIDRPTFYTEV